jgi:hypothetical protein
MNNTNNNNTNQFTPNDLTVLNQDLRNVSGSLCVFGDWFGRPMDNFHKVIKFEIKPDYLRIDFNDDETLETWNGNHVEIRNTQLLIHNASRVRWEWYYYGKPKLLKNRFFIEHTVGDDKVKADSNATWYKPEYRPTLRAPAIRIG